MQSSQIIFLLALLAFGVYTTRLRSALIDRLVYLLLSVVGMLLALHPDGATTIANTIGVGRGVDLLFYVFIVFSLFYHAGSAARMRRMERDTTAVVRALAIANAERGDGSKLVESQA